MTQSSNSPALPPIGFGCSPYREGRVVDLGPAIERALDIGYRLFDTAELYGNERQIGRILGRLSGRSRDEVVVVSKLWRTNHGYEQALAACEASLDRLGLEALDLYLVHAPEAWRYAGPLGDLSRLSAAEARSRAFPLRSDGSPALSDVPLAETWSAMEELLRRGRVRAIGISNFERPQLEELLRQATVPPAVLQIERHPYRPRRDLLKLCRRQRIDVMAHSPLSATGLLAEPALASIGRALDRSAAQVALRWQIEDGVVPLPSSRQPAHIEENFGALEFRLRQAELAAVSRLARSEAADRGGGSE